jgi:thiol-disulfide isomerase/thioredoxin
VEERGLGRHEKALFYPALRTRHAAALLVLLAPLAAAAGHDTPLALTDLEGRPAELALGASESAVVVHFWATWCRECVSELPALASAARACAGDPVRVVAVNVGESADEVARWRAEHPFDLPVLRDADGKVWRRFARGLPANLIWTRTGQRSDTGLRTEPEWRTTLTELGCV